jgi:hypothetical protein
MLVPLETKELRKQIKGNWITLHTLSLIEKLCFHMYELATKHDIDFSKWNHMHLELRDKKLLIEITMEE